MNQIDVIFYGTESQYYRRRQISQGAMNSIKTGCYALKEQNNTYFKIQTELSHRLIYKENNNQ